ncbi:MULTISPECIES: hypothetical protein [Trichocoleus]|uniref:Uncharacterized protein n=1 Tax=Trichocoleus desertorum GB2-A4 TaxID=2933944 RepID=A0ABV0J5I6_9CYAN|nr:hypothetical protein [Trichocoleus sp. FACHB-46]MBD1863863.1 hypothetical protein [Trichocoleus sp. FACHB-46]
MKPHFLNSSSLAAVALLDADKPFFGDRSPLQQFFASGDREWDNTANNLHKKCSIQRLFEIRRLVEYRNHDLFDLGTLNPSGL